MKLNAIGWTTVSSLLIIALSQSVEARSLRADDGPGNGWTLQPDSPYTSSPYSLNPGVITPYAASIGNFTSGFQDDVLGLNTGLTASSAMEYNWYSTNPNFTSNSNLQLVTPVSQILVYTLADNSMNPNSDLPSTVSTAGDFEFEFNYGSASANSNAMAQFTFNKVTYTAPVSELYAAAQNSTGQQDVLLFSKTQGFVGSLITDSSGLVGLLPTMGDWTASGPVVHGVPEIDSSSAIAGLTLLMGMLAVLRGKTNPHVHAANS